MTSAESPAILMPTKIEPFSPTELLMAWNTGESFAIPYPDLRFECPCAHCVDEHTGKRVIRREQVGKDVRVKGVSLIGRYAVQIEWSDGHGTGIYHYDRLHELSKKYGRVV